MRVLGVDPGGSYTALVLREGDKVIHATCLFRDNWLLDGYLERVLAELTDITGESHVDLVAVEGVHPPTPHMGTISVAGLIGCAAVLGAVVAWCWTDQMHQMPCHVVPPGKHGGAPSHAYPPALVGRRPTRFPGVGPRKHEQSAYDVAGAGRAAAPDRRREEGLVMATEYRVVWQREPYRGDGGFVARPPARKYSQHYASLAAAQRKAMRLEGRIAESKGRDRDDFLCCDGSDYGGYPCSCDGKTWGEWEDETTAEWTPLAMLRIESREVGAWSPVLSTQEVAHDDT